MNALIEKLKTDPKKAFLLDGVGALLSAFSLGVVLVQFQSSFGVSTGLLYALALAAVLLAVYSFSCYKWFPDKWRPFLKIIALANLIYCGVTIWTVLLENETLTTLGYLYFIGEVIIIVSLVFVELRVARS